MYELHCFDWLKMLIFVWSIKKHVLVVSFWRFLQISCNHSELEKTDTTKIFVDTGGSY